MTAAWHNFSVKNVPQASPLPPPHTLSFYDSFFTKNVLYKEKAVALLLLMEFCVVLDNDMAWVVKEMDEGGEIKGIIRRRQVNGWLLWRGVFGINARLTFGRVEHSTCSSHQ